MSILIPPDEGDRRRVSPERRDLLFGLLALQNNCVNRDALLSAFEAWVADKGRPLAQLLVDRGAIDGAQRARLEALLGEHLSQPAGEIELCLTTVGAVGSLRDDLERLNDADIRNTLAGVAFERSVRGVIADYGVGSDTQAGTRVRYFGDYELLRELGSGGMGIVYQARQLSLNRPVALKMIKAARFASADDVRRFQNEAEAVARMDHPNIVPIFEIGHFEDQHYFSMKLIAGDSLDKRIKDFMANPRGTARLVATAAAAIHHAHQRGILHRDMKPANVLVDPDGYPHVTDFGLAKRVEGESELTQSGAILGTPAYMAPEQASGKRGNVTTATDIHGLGGVFYALLTGRAPFKGTTVLDILEQVREREPDPPRRLNPLVPRDLEMICLKCLEKDPRNRYASADALAQDLTRWLAGEPIAARRSSRWEVVVKLMRRRPAIAALSATVLVVGLTGGVGVVWQLRAAVANAKEAKTHETSARIALLEAERQNDAARLNAYVARMNLAQREWDEGNVNRTLDLLDGERPTEGHADLRGFEWFYLNRLCHSELMKLEGHARAVNAVAFSPDGHRIASASDDGKIKVWDATAGVELFTLRGHVGKVRHVAFSPDGLRIASASEDQTVKVWDAISGHEARTIEGHRAQVFGLAFSPDGHRIASASEDSTVMVWDASTGQELGRHEGHIGWVYRVAFSPDGRRIAAAGVFGRVEVWDTVSGRSMLTLEGDPRFAGVTFRSDRVDRFGVLAGVSMAVTARDIISGHHVIVLNNDTYAEGRLAHSVAFSPDGRRIASDGWDHAVKVWDATSGQEVLTIAGHTDSVSSVAFSPGGDRIASASLDRTLKLWDAKSGREMFTLKGHTGKVRHLVFSPDGHRIASASEDRTVKVWDALSGHDSQTFKLRRVGLSHQALSPDCRQVAELGFDGTLEVWEIGTGREPMTLKHAGWSDSLAFSPDGRRIASGAWDTVKVWDTRSGQETLTLKEHGGTIHCVAFSPDGGRIASAGLNGMAKVWDARSGLATLTLKAHNGSVNCVAFSPDGRCITSGGLDRIVKVWDTNNGEVMLRLEGHTDEILGLAFSPDGRRIASACADSTVKVWDANMGHEIHALKGHTESVRAVAFSSDGRRIVSASDDGKVKVWDATSGQEVLTLKGHSGKIRNIAFSRDGRRIASVGEDQTVKVWDAW